MGKVCQANGNSKARARGRKVLGKLREWPMGQIRVWLPVGATENETRKGGDLGTRCCSSGPPRLWLVRGKVWLKRLLKKGPVVGGAGRGLGH